MAVKVIAQAGTEVSHEVIAAHKVSAADRAADGEPLVEAQAFPSYARPKFGGRVFAQLGGVDPAKIIEERTIGLETGIQVPAGSPSQFAAHTKPLLQEKVRADNRVGPPVSDTGLWSPEALDAEGAVSVPTPKATSNCCA